MMPNYPFNCWYVAAASDEVGQSLLGRRLLNVPVVLYRTGSGSVVAMEDRCVHRPYPLSAGHLEGDRVVCAHDGWTYGPDGLCVDVRSQGKVPLGARVRTFPVIERGPLLWVWLGQPGVAALRTPPRTPWLTDDGWATVGEQLHVEANYLLLHEHYLDLTSVFAMHPENMPPGLDRLPSLDEVEVSEMAVRYSRALPPARLAGWEAEATGLPRGPEYHRTERGAFVSPALHVQHWVIEGEGVRPHEQVRIHGFTPETPTSTHVFLRVARNYAIDSTLVDTHFRTVFRGMLDRDAALLAVVQQRLAEEGEPRRDLNVKADRAAIRARRVVQSMVAEEAGVTAAKVVPPVAVGV
jgi:vanillate O-demethylase monooxygenase subunit